MPSRSNDFVDKMTGRQVFSKKQLWCRPVRETAATLIHSLLSFFFFFLATLLILKGPVKKNFYQSKSYRIAVS
jgi:hypothetical protein